MRSSHDASGWLTWPVGLFEDVPLPTVPPTTPAPPAPSDEPAPNA